MRAGPFFRRTVERVAELFLSSVICGNCHRGQPSREKIVTQGEQWPADETEEKENAACVGRRFGVREAV